nr:MAG TPA: hypothetical protein [Caudoviricetes sp.]
MCGKPLLKFYVLKTLIPYMATILPSYMKN